MAKRVKQNYRDKFPAEIFVVNSADHVDDGGEKYFDLSQEDYVDGRTSFPDSDGGEVETGDLVAVYELVSVSRASVGDVTFEEVD